MPTSRKGCRIGLKESCVANVAAEKPLWSRVDASVILRVEWQTPDSQSSQTSRKRRQLAPLEEGGTHIFEFHSWPNPELREFA